MQPLAVILDFDGVVADSLHLHLAAWQEAVAEIFGRSLPPPEDMGGHAMRTVAHILAKRYGDPARAAALAAEKERRLAARFGSLPLLPGAREFIAALAARGMPHGIASNSPRAFVAGALAGAGLTVPVLVTGSDVSRGKPAPNMLWECANQLAIAPGDRGRIAVYEDSPQGLRAAGRAGMVPLGVATSVAVEQLIAAGAVGICASLADALDQGWLGQCPG